jgi:hypothetical protein
VLRSVVLHFIQVGFHSLAATLRRVPSPPAGFEAPLPSPRLQLCAGACTVRTGEGVASATDAAVLERQPRALPADGRAALHAEEGEEDEDEEGLRDDQESAAVAAGEATVAAGWLETGCALLAASAAHDPGALGFSTTTGAAAAGAAAAGAEGATAAGVAAAGAALFRAARAAQEPGALGRGFTAGPAGAAGEAVVTAEGSVTVTGVETAVEALLIVEHSLL